MIRHITLHSYSDHMGRWLQVVILLPSNLRHYPDYTATKDITGASNATLYLVQHTTKNHVVLNMY